MARLDWDADADAAISRAPFFVRGLARRKVEQLVRSRGDDRVRLHDVEEAQAKFRAVADGKSESELGAMLPQANQIGAELVVIEQCQSELTDCPNTLLRPGPWRAAIEAWIRDRDVSERLRRHLHDDKVLYHHKLRISISGCPNGCSRPQIADFGIVGAIHPQFDSSDCTACGACEAACPDRAITVDQVATCNRQLCQGCTRCRDACAFDCITLSPARAQVTAGGKLGRHPHLGEVVAILDRPEQLVALLESEVERFLTQAYPSERFADFWLRTRDRQPLAGRPDGPIALDHNLSEFSLSPTGKPG